MKKVFLVIRFIGRGQGFDEEPFKVFTDQKKATECAKSICGYVKELDFVDD